MESEEAAFLRSLPSDPQTVLLELIREVDVQFLCPPADERGEEGTDHRVATTREESLFGWNKALRLILKPARERIPFYPSSDSLGAWARTALERCGRIAMCETLLDQEQARLYDLVDRHDSQFRFRLVPGIIGAEFAERRDGEWLAKLITDASHDREGMLDRAEVELTPIMRQRVHRWKSHFIRYTTTPEIDQHYLRAGMLRVYRMSGSDSFPDGTVLGKLRFEVCMAAAGVIAGWGLKHLRFSELLVARFPDVLFRNALVIMYDKRTLHRALAAVLDVDECEAADLLSLFVLTPQNREVLTSVTAGPRPPFIETGSDFVVQSVAGMVDAPVEFMLRELRRRYPRDWDRGLQSREAIFRDELRQLIASESLAWSVVARNLKQGSLLTDVDAVCLDLRAGTLGLFQLKWQEPFGRAMRERESRRRNLVEKGNRWVEVTSSWLTTRDRRGVAMELGLPARVAALVRDVKLFVIGRHFSHFSHPSGECDLDTRAAWGNWAQIVRLLRTTVSLNVDPLAALDHGLRADSACRRVQPTAPSQEIQMDSFRVIIDGFPAP